MVRLDRAIAKIEYAKAIWTTNAYIYNHTHMECIDLEFLGVMFV